MSTLARMSKNFLTGHWGALGASIVLASVTTALGLAVPWLTKLMVDRALVGQRPDLILPLAGAVAGIGLLKFVAGLARRLVSGRMSLAVEYSATFSPWDRSSTAIGLQANSYPDPSRMSALSACS